ncbi:hypothetical protein TNIN_286941 [Trichonephila inaurata madagascariensis]|uniref:Uncharacterized protein n=1 Tax=Trichonephila inaurata madagascariensis TaxID=2747483 RepID=A0A8X7BND9_9ARAC|nr:hypothetical protein TNIN_286941 [Trichonephila inaurata madagascariensis]
MKKYRLRQIYFHFLKSLSLRFIYGHSKTKSTVKLLPLMLNSCSCVIFAVESSSSKSSMMKSVLACLLALSLLTTCYGFAITVQCYKKPDGTNECIKHIDYNSNVASVSTGNAQAYAGPPIPNNDAYANAVAK